MTSSEQESLSPLAIPIFRAVWIATLVSSFGGLIQSVGASWMMTALTNSPTMVALVQSSIALPFMLLSLMAGAVADNWDRRLVMLSAQIFLFVVSSALSIFAWTGLITPWLLLCFTFLVGCGAAFNGPAWQSSVGDMVPRRALPAAVALNSVGFNIARSAGPAIGGTIVAVAGAAAAFVVNAVSYLGLIFVLSRWRPAREPRLLPRESLGYAMTAGIRYVAMSPSLRSVMTRAFTFGFAASVVQALMPVVARDVIGGGPLTYGVLLCAFGLGAVAGAFCTRMLRARFSAELVVRLATGAMVIGTTGAGISTFLPFTAFALLFAGAGWMLVLSTFNVVVQMATPRWVVARALAIYQMSIFAGIAGGSWIFGTIAEHLGVADTMLIAAVLQIVGLAMARRRQLPQVDDLNLDLLRRWKTPDTVVPVESRSGPIVVSIRYRIAPENVVRFLNLMDERRRVRRRDGARQWMLLRDLADADVWVERYETPTWLEYVRHNQRQTHDDAAFFDQIIALHMGPGRPEVTRMIERRTGSLPLLRALSSREMAATVSDPSQST